MVRGVWVDEALASVASGPWGQALELTYQHQHWGVGLREAMAVVEGVAAIFRGWEGAWTPPRVPQPVQIRMKGAEEVWED